MKSRLLLLCGATLCSWCLTTRSVFAQSTAFTYQGRLNVSGQPANGSYDLVFSLFPASTGTNNQIGSRITNNATPVSSGLFSLPVDFGASPFTGPDRWLQLEVRPNGGGALTTLSPRQLLSPVPYALHSSLADTALTANTAGSVLNGVYTTNTYADPSWITSLSAGKINGNIAGKAAGFLGNLSGDVSGAQGATLIVGSAVTTAKIADSAVTAAKIAAGAVGSSQIAAGAVGNSQLAAGAVTEAKISAAAVLVTNLNADLLDGLHSSSFAQTGAGPESKNVGFCNTAGTAAVWDSSTSMWSQISLGGSSSGLIGSGGNIAFANNSGNAAVWCMTTKTWITIPVTLGSGYGGMAGSKGNFIVANNNGKAAAWSNLTKVWTQVSIGSGYGGIAASGGNFVVANSGYAAAWNDPAGTWSIVALGGGYGDIAGSAGNFVVVNNGGTAAAWNHLTGAWTTLPLGGATGPPSGYVTGSDQW
jgi:hypothetical protein